MRTPSISLFRLTRHHRPSNLPLLLHPLIQHPTLRLVSTTPKTPSIDPPSPHPTGYDPPTPPPVPPRSGTSDSSYDAPKPRRSTSPLIFGAFSLVLGLIGGNVMRVMVDPPTPPVLGSAEDQALLKRLEYDAEGIPLLKEMRTGVEKGTWKEISVSADDRTAIAKYTEVGGVHGDREVRRGGTLIAESTRGSRGLGVERVFWNEEEKKLVAIVFFGTGLAGWPGVAHGGAIATVMNEKMGLTAELSGMEGSRYGTGHNEPDSLSLSYVAPTRSNDFYVLRATLAPSPSAPPVAALGGIVPPQPVQPGGNSSNTREIDATLESQTGKVCVKARATFSATGDMNGGEGTHAPDVEKGRRRRRRWWVLGKWFS